MPAGGSGTTIYDARKVIDHLDKQMIEFIKQSPFLQLATAHTNALNESVPFVSPKGDEAGFVSVRKDQTGKRGTALIIPDRPGNRLIFGLQNILQNPNVSILFEIPKTKTTLRVGGRAYLSIDPQLLEKHKMRGCEPKVAIVVEVGHAFFHCGKSYMRSRLWEPSSWPEKEFKVSFGQYFISRKAIIDKIDKDVDDHYKGVQKAIDGQGCEVEH